MGASGLLVEAHTEELTNQISLKRSNECFTITRVGEKLFGERIEPSL